MSSDALRIVNAWVAAANRGDVEGLLALSAPDVEVAGPRGSAYGHQLLRDWLARAGVQFETRDTYVKDNSVVLDQRAIWRSAETGGVSGDAIVATRFRVTDGKVDLVSRHDFLDIALVESGLTTADRYAE